MAEVPNLVGIETGRRLVHDEHLRVVQQRLGHPDALAKSPGQLSDGLFHHLTERTEGGHFLDPARQGRRRHFARLPEEPEQLRRSHVRVERAVFRQVAEPAGGFETLLVDVQAGDLGGARAGREIAGQHLHRGGLPGAVRPEKGHDLAPGNREAHVLDGHEGPVELTEIARLDHDLVGHSRYLSIGGEKAVKSSPGRERDRGFPDRP